MFGIFKSEAITERSKHEGIQLALDYMVRGLAPHFEDEHHNPPPEVLKAMNALALLPDNAKTYDAAMFEYLMAIHEIGEAIGRACARKALATQTN